MCVLLCYDYFGDAYVCQLPIFGKWRIPCYCEFLTRLHLVEQYFYWVFGVIRRLNVSLIIHEVSVSYLAVPNIDPVHKFNKILDSIPHYHIFLSLDQLVVYGCNGYFI